MRRSVLLAFALAVVATPFASPSSAQSGAHPSFAGKWTLDLTASPPSPMLPTSETFTITQDDKTINVQSDATIQGDEQKTSEVINLDGSPSQNTLNAGGQALQITSVATWDGPTLVVTNSVQVQGNDVKQVDRYSLSSDGATLTRATGMDAGGQHLGDATMIFKKG